MASAGWDEVLGGGGSGGMDGGDPPPPVDGGDDEVDDDAPKKKRVKTSTKIVLVAAAWILLTLFLVGRFSSDKPQPSAVARLDAVAGDDGVAAGEEEAFEPEPVDTEEEELLDTDGDGFLSAAEQGITEGEAAAASEGGGSGSGSGSGSGAIEGTPTGEGGSSGGGNAVPGAAPGGGSTTTTARSGSGATTTTTAGGGGSTTSSTPTTKPGNGSTTTTSSTTSSTTSTTAGQPASPVTLNVSGDDLAYHFPQGYSENFSLPAGSKIRFDNTEGGNSVKHSFTISGGDAWDSGEIKRDDGTRLSPELNTKGTFDYRCTVHPLVMRGKITIT